MGSDSYAHDETESVLLMLQLYRLTCHLPLSGFDWKYFDVITMGHPYSCDSWGKFMK